MHRRGTAAESDYLAVKAERLGVAQAATDLQAQRQSLARMLSTFCGIEVQAPVRPAQPVASASSLASAPSVPSVALSTQPPSRPELSVIDARLRLIDAQEASLTSALLPRFSLFAQGYYGYPGYNMFEDMMSRRLSWNGMIGARLTWNIGALYTRRNDKAKLSLQRSMYGVQRETFLFNNSLEQIQQGENIGRYKKLMEDDEEIIALRSSIRKAAESKLSHGIIDVNDLLREINSENGAKVQQRVHEIEMLKEIYDMKYTVNL